MKKLGIALMLILVCALALISTSGAWAYPVPELPENNLLVNPWFRSAEDPNVPGLDGWTNILTDGVGWGVSQKNSNPAPAPLECGRETGYCGTGARWANENGNGTTMSYPGQDVFLYQVVQTDPAHRRLSFSMYWVNHKIDVTEVLVYGSDSPSGPWEDVWLPITISQDVNPGPCCQPGQNGNPWLNTGLLETTLNHGFIYYKVLFHARYPESSFSQGDVGVKITGVYFSTSESTDPTSLSTPVVVINPTVPGSGDPTTTPTNPPPTATPIGTVPPPTATPGGTDPTSTPIATDPPRSTPGPTETPHTR